MNHPPKSVLPFGLRPKTLKFIGFLMDSRFCGFCGQLRPRSRNQLDLTGQCKIVMEMQRMY